MAAQQHKPRYAETEREDYNQQIAEIVKRFDPIRRKLTKQTMSRMLSTTYCKAPYWQRKRKAPAQRQTCNNKLGEPRAEKHAPTNQSYHQTAGTQWYQRGVHKACAEMMMELMIAAFRMKGLI